MVLGVAGCQVLVICGDNNAHISRDGKLMEAVLELSENGEHNANYLSLPKL